MIGKGHLYSESTKRVIGCAMRVHSVLGRGFQEVIYQRALAREMGSEGIAFGREVDIPIFYKGWQVGTRRVDFLVDDRITVELKAVSELDDAHLAQAINYVEAFNLDVGLLINFGGASLEVKRLHNNKRRNR